MQKCHSLLSMYNISIYLSSVYVLYEIKHNLAVNASTATSIHSNPSCARYRIKNGGKIPYHCSLYPFCIKTVLIFQILFTCIN